MEAPPPPPPAAAASNAPPPNPSSEGQSHPPQPNPPPPLSASSSSSGTAVHVGQTLNNPTANVPPSSAAASVEQQQQQQQQQKMSAVGSATKKRKMTTSGDHRHQHFQNSCYFKIRAAVKDLRPSFLEVVHAADFRDCKAACDIRKKMKMILELYKQLRVETAPPAPPERQSSTGEHTQAGMNYQEAADTKAGPPQQSGIPPIQDDAQRVCESDKEPKLQAQVVDTPEAKVASGTNDTEQRQGEKGSFVIGGSPIGWNFIVCSSEEPVYYGLTKASWRAKQVANS